MEAYWGDARSARLHAVSALKLSRSKDSEYLAAYSLGLVQDFTPVRGVADDLEKRFPKDTRVQFSQVPTLRALLALSRNNPEEAIEILQVSTPVELGSFPDPIYVRGLAFLALRRGPDAAAEFQKILDHRGIVINDPSGALAHLQLGRAYVLSGERSKARKAYENFLKLWKNADPDLAILALAKAEYAQLPQGPGSEARVKFANPSVEYADVILPTHSLTTELVTDQRGLDKSDNVPYYGCFTKWQAALRET